MLPDERVDEIALRIAQGIAGALVGGISLPILTVMLWGWRPPRITGGEMFSAEGLPLLTLWYYALRGNDDSLHRAMFLTGLLVGAGALLGALIGALVKKWEISRRGKTIAFAGVMGGWIGVAPGICFVGAWPANVLIGLASGTVCGIILGRLWCRGRIRLWEMMLAVALIALACRVVSVWFPR